MTSPLICAAEVAERATLADKPPKMTYNPMGQPVSLMFFHIAISIGRNGSLHTCRSRNPDRCRIAFFFVRTSLHAWFFAMRRSHG